MDRTFKQSYATTNMFLIKLKALTKFINIIHFSIGKIRLFEKRSFFLFALD